MRFCFAICLSALLAACGAGSQRDNSEGLYTPPELEPLREIAFSCWQDSYLVPIEHSEHCVIVAETILENRKEECDLDRSYECLEYSLARDNIYAMYQGAINTSLLEFGASEEIKAASELTVPTFVYFDGKLLRDLFEDCLEDEQRELGRKGFQRVHSVTLRTLEEGQLCIREGYPDFKVEKI